MMTYRGHIEKGVAVLDEAVKLPDGTPVRIEILPTSENFWQGKSVAELALEQNVPPLPDPQSLAVDWPPEDPIEDLLIVVRDSRH